VKAPATASFSERTREPSERAMLSTTLHEAARAAGALLLDFYRRADLTVELKGPSDLVTSADHAAEQAILARIRAAYPDHAILAEESGLHAGQRAGSWYIDPLDGTLNYASQLPYWCTSLAVQAGDVRLGVIYAPLLDEYFATADAGVALNGRPTAMRHVAVGDALVYTHIGRAGPRQVEALAICTFLAPRIRRLRMMGSLALALAYVAAGRLDGVLQIGAYAWDFMAGAWLVQQAGGIVSAPDGTPIRPDAGGIAAAATPELHRTLIQSVVHARSPMDER
jgi:myo-inositol-1(or 4)-monophosphatase